MRGNNKLHNRPYIPHTLKERREKPYICRLAPDASSFELEWLEPSLDKRVPENVKGYSLYYRVREDGDWSSIDVESNIVTVEGLDCDCDYEIYIAAPDGRKSDIRLVRTGAIPAGCTVINYLHPEDDFFDFSGKYLCSPSLARVKSGRLIAGMDLFGPGMPQNLTTLFYSDNDGKDWKYLTDLYPFYWASLFYHKEVLYILGLTTEYGNLQIACSHDEGVTWSVPTTILYGSSMVCKYGGVHRAPMHMVSYKGRLYTTCEYGCWNMKSHRPAVLSIDQDADFMVAENWVCSEFLPFEGEWKERAVTQGDTMEGNVVIAPDGQMYNYLRWRMGSMLKLRVNMQDLEQSLEFADIVEAPVSNSMFRIIPDGDKYLLVTNRKTPEAAKYECWSYRNVLSLFETKDLENFTFIKDIVNYEKMDAKEVGFQYPTFLYEEGKLSLVIRSAFNNSHNSHDSNYMLFYSE